jgi:holo-[acyl-carrier protein] synthase
LIQAVGLDIVSIERIARLMANPRFLDKILTPAERDHCKTPRQVAGRWAAKEAVMKCCPHVKTFREIEVLPGPGGVPAIMQPPGIWHLSITHDAGVAAAVAILGRDPAP